MHDDIRSEEWALITFHSVERMCGCQRDALVSEFDHREIFVLRNTLCVVHEYEEANAERGNCLTERFLRAQKAHYEATGHWQPQ